MGSGPRIPLYYVPVGLIEELQDMKVRHRADGVVTREEDVLEHRQLHLVMTAVVDNAEAADYAGTVYRYGIQADAAQRKWQRAVRRNADLIVVAARRAIRRYLNDDTTSRTA